MAADVPSVAPALTALACIVLTCIAALLLYARGLSKTLERPYGETLHDLIQRLNPWGDD